MDSEIVNALVVLLRRSKPRPNDWWEMTSDSGYTVAVMYDDPCEAFSARQLATTEELDAALALLRPPPSASDGARR